MTLKCGKQMAIHRSSGETQYASTTEIVFVVEPTEDGETSLGVVAKPVKVPILPNRAQRREMHRRRRPR